ncbi:MAG: thioredoxin domain-containing protein [Pyrinomonadaceae bacterium]
MKKTLPFIIILVVLGAALGATWYLKQAASQSPTIASKPATSDRPAPTTAPAGPISTGAIPPYVLGPAGAPVTLEEFGDFECPPCGMLHPVLQTMHNEFGDRVKIVFREFPLVPTHQHALAAAKAAEAAGMQGRFWEMHDMLYENQKAWHEVFDARPVFDDYAKRLNLDMDRFHRDFDNDAVDQRIFQDQNRGHSLGVKGTPTVFINGREIPFESLPAEKLRVVIQAELAGHK